MCAKASTAQIGSLPDRATIWGISAILVATPLAVGGVEPWAYIPIEALIFLLLALWMARGLIGGGETAKLDRLAARQLGVLALPATLLIGLIAFQMIPLPPGVERLISPATFGLYQRSLPDSPNNPHANQSRLLNRPTPHAIVALPTAAEVEAGAPIPFRDSGRSEHGSNESAQRPTMPSIGVWRTLSIAPSLTEPALLKLIAYTGLFLLVTAYPFREDAERHLGQHLAIIVLVAGLITASVALLERVYSNGRVLWLFAPYDWRGSNPWGDRAVGSFANPDHLANYLAQTLPFAVAGFIWPAALSRRRPQVLRVVAGAALIIVSSALLLSSSRGGWIDAVMALIVLGALWPRGDGIRQSRTLGKSAVGMSAGLFLIGVLMFVGPGGRTQTDARLKDTVANESLVDREVPAFTTLAMVRDFPLFGVGLGCWPEIFPHYVTPPWTSIFYNATHNDYAQLAAETGLIGFAFLAWFMIGVWQRIHRGMEGLKPEARLLVAAVLAAASATALHEFFDFPLQIPANALLLTSLLALAVRLTGEKKVRTPGRRLIERKYIYDLSLLAAVGLLLAAVTQKRTPYPYDLKSPANLNQAYALVDAHPANAEAHLALALMLDGTAAHADRIKELRAAVWLAPTNPYSRDLYAQALLGQNKTAAGFNQIARSVAYSPDLATHFYLRPRIIPWLTEPERNAISAGFSFAVAHRYHGAVENFASYDDELGDAKAEAALYEAAAESASGDARRATYLDNAGRSYLNAGEPKQAEAAWRAAIATAPANSGPYVRLIDGVFGPAKDWSAANKLIAQGIRQGADPVMLYRALAQAAQTAGDYTQARDALRLVLAAWPADFAAVMQMGRLELADNHPGRAATWFRRATQLRPTSAQAFSELGRAEAGAYEYFAADQAYRRAVAIAPRDGGLRQQYAAFRQRVADNSKVQH